VNLAAVFGKYLHKSGEIEEKERKEVTVFRDIYEQRYKNMPPNAILINSSTGHSLPYPALMYGRGAWAAVDLLFFLPDIPMTFIGEGYGYAYKTNILNSAEYNRSTKEKQL